MRIQFVEIANFRKLLSVRVDLAKETTLLVGANNSGKTSAMLAMRHFLFDQGAFCINDFTLCHWETINAIGTSWQLLPENGGVQPTDSSEWTSVLPTLDLWFNIEEGEIHYVSKLIPTLDWEGGLLGVRLRLEPKNIEELYKDYLVSVGEAAAIQTLVPQEEGKPTKTIKLWPENMLDFVQRRLKRHFSVHAYLLDPTKIQDVLKGQARLQALAENAQPLEDDPLSGLIRIHEINAQRGFGQVTESTEQSDAPANRSDRRLSDQLRRYYVRHLDPFDKPVQEDLEALQAIESAEGAFDKRLEASFFKAFAEVQGIGYPGVTDPKLKVSTRLRPIDGLDHDSAVTYEIDVVMGSTKTPVLRLPEGYNGLGYQNLVSMIFALMSFRDAWMRVGKAGKTKPGTADDRPIEPLHLVLVEEPEAHLHAQVQQVFIKKAYEILTDMEELRANPQLSTQLMVSTHSSHVAHETAFSCLRYFRRLPAGMASNVPVSSVLNLSQVFGGNDETERFTTRYLRANHCDLFFADAAILVEGPAERMLVPHFIRENFKFLNQCYVTLLEIGGSHAHRLQPLIEHLGLLTLVITDLDAGSGGSSAQPTRGSAQTSSNPTLKQWIPQLELVDALLAANDDAKIDRQDQLAAVRVAYQCAIQFALEPTKAEEALPSTFEDALVFENVQFFSGLDGTGLVKKFSDALQNKKTAIDIGKALFDALKNGKKAEFALDVIDAKEFATLKTPAYIAEGLAWLEDQLRKKQAEIIPTANSTGGPNA
jgi:predicted ATP-dependent endonuclease of OLD family